MKSANNIQTTDKQSLPNIKWQAHTATELYDLPLMELLFKAASVHRENFDPNQVQISTLLSIKTGSCPEDCKYCPQSAHYKTDLQKQDLLDVDTIVAAAKAAKANGASRFCMGAAWRNINDRDLPKLQEIILAVKNLELETCVTLGMASREQLSCLKEAGLDYYNHNIDTSPGHYEKIITTRTFSDRLDTLENIKQAGLKTCCGGIVGMGEDKNDRIQMLLTLANMEQPPESVPINLLVKVAGTPLAENLTTTQEFDNFDFIRTIALARIMLPKSYVRLSAGRESMSQEMQALCFFAGANSIFYGEKLLTTPNNEQTSDLGLFQKLGLTCI